MRLMLRLFTAFCVATVIAQAVILAMAAFRGNLKTDLLVKGAALLNGIDISGDRLQKMLDDYRKTPVPPYEEVLEKRAVLGLNLQARERSIADQKKKIDETSLALEKREQSFDQRLTEFYEMLDKEKANLLDESLVAVKSSFENMAPDQAKVQLLKLWDMEVDKKKDVLAIVNAMQDDKWKKIMGEFTGQAEEDKLNEILVMQLEGGTTAKLLEDAAGITQP